MCGCFYCIDLLEKKMIFCVFSRVWLFLLCFCFGGIGLDVVMWRVVIILI